MSASVPKNAFAPSTLGAHALSSHPVRDDHPRHFDRALSAIVTRANLGEKGRRARSCLPHISSVKAWIERTIRPVGENTRFGTVPVKVHSLTFQGTCVPVDGGREDAAIAEFIAHRFGDAWGAHFKVHVSVTIPYKLFRVERVGSVPEDQLVVSERSAGKRSASPSWGTGA